MVCADVKKWPATPIARSIAYQLLDAAGSISANIAEGYGRGIPGEIEQFLRYGRGSRSESDNWLYKAMKQKLITEMRYDEYQNRFSELGTMTASFIHKLRIQTKRKYGH